MTASEPNSYATVPPTSTVTSASASAGSKFDVNDIVMHFGREYYTTLSCSPERLHCFYGKQSSLLHCQEEDTEAAVCVGLEEIHDRIISMGYNGTRVVIGNIDCQPSMNGGILIFVLGTMHWPSGGARKFAQTFLLAEQPNGYFVLNDVLRILSSPTSSTTTAAPIPETKDFISKTAPANHETTTKALVSKKDEPTTSIVATIETTVDREKHTAEKIQSTNAANTVSSSTLAPSSPQKQQQNQQTGERKKKSAASGATSATLETPSKKTTIDPEAQAKSVSTTPSSWASLAAGQQNRWQSGTLAESKGPVASIPVETGKENEAHNGQQSSGRVSYRTNNNNNNNNSGDRDRRSYQRSQEKSNDHQQPRSDNGPHRQYRTEYDASKSIYVSQIAGDIKRDVLRKLFEQQFGEIKHFEVVSTKGMAFIEFNTEASQKAALAAKQISFNNAPMKIEPRRAPRDLNNSNGRHFSGKSPQQSAIHE